jgi:hypothetical protein
MGVLKKRTRLISFRLSDEEYQTLLAITAAQGARSISDFSRAALGRALKDNLNRLNPEQDLGLPGQVRDLIKTMRELGNVITDLSHQIEKESTDIARRSTKEFAKVEL